MLPISVRSFVPPIKAKCRELIWRWARGSAGVSSVVMQVRAGKCIRDGRDVDIFGQVVQEFTLILFCARPTQPKSAQGALEIMATNTRSDQLRSV